MIDQSKELMIIGYGFVGLIAGILIGIIRTKAPDSTVIKYGLIVAFITPFAYVVTNHLLFGVSMLLGVAIGTVSVYIFQTSFTMPGNNPG